MNSPAFRPSADRPHRDGDVDAPDLHRQAMLAGQGHIHEVAEPAGQLVVLLRAEDQVERHRRARRGDVELESGGVDGGVAAGEQSRPASPGVPSHEVRDSDWFGPMIELSAPSSSPVARTTPLVTARSANPSKVPAAALLPV